MFIGHKDSQTSNKLNTTPIPLAATPLCMVANIVLALSLGGDNVSPNPINATIRSHKSLLYTLHYCSLLPCRVWRTYKQLCFAPPNLFGYIFYLMYCCHTSLNSKTNGRKSKPPKP